MSNTHSSLKRTGTGLLRVAAILALLFSAVPSARAQTLTTLYSFTGGADGSEPQADLIMDGQGNLYGATPSGGAYNCGTVFELTVSGAFELLSTFAGGTDGCGPLAALTRDNQGNLYGATFWGGAYGGGTVFMVTPSGVKTVLHNFTAGGEGAQPQSTVVLDAQGNLYGTTIGGGTCGHGTVFELTPSGTATALHRFNCPASIIRTTDGANPEAGVMFDSQGNLYGTTTYGGVYGAGTVFKVTPNKRQWNTELYNFTGGGDGRQPHSGVVVDTQGNVYGTTMFGGDSYDCSLGGCGTVFQITPSGTEKVLHTFTAPPDGHWPTSDLVLDAQGNLYGTTAYGGAYDYTGTVFMVTPSGTEKVLYSFSGGADGGGPWGGLVRDAQGNLYGTTYSGGTYGYGTVFKLTP